MMNVDNILSQYNVFLTGSSGFVGTVILQRLLRIKNSSNSKIFCLLRPSKNYLSVTKRLKDEILKHEIMELSNNDIENMINSERVVAIEGTLHKQLLGLNRDTIDRLKECSLNNNTKGIIFIHCAADVKFHTDFNDLMNTNVNGTFQCIKLCKEMNGIAFNHISTLYVNSRQDRNANVEEQIYNNGLNNIQIFENWLDLKSQNLGFDEDYISKIKSQTGASSRKNWANNYVFAKNIAENVVDHYCNLHGISSSIIRLGMISGMHKGKHSYWYSKTPGAVICGIKVCTGGLLYQNTDGLGKPECVPVDYTADCVLCIAAKTIKDSVQNVFNSCVYQCGIHYGLSDRTWGDIIQHAKNEYSQGKMVAEIESCIRSNKKYINPNFGVRFINNNLMFYLIESIRFDIPLFILNFFCSILVILTQITGVKLLKKTINKINYLNKSRQNLKWYHDNFSFFQHMRWNFINDNVLNLGKMLDSESSLKYDLDPQKIDYFPWTYNCSIHGMIKYITHKEKAFDGSTNNATRRLRQ